MAVFILEDALCIWASLGKHSLFVSSVKTDTRRIICLDELSSLVRRSLTLSPWKKSFPRGPRPDNLNHLFDGCVASICQHLSFVSWGIHCQINVAWRYVLINRMNFYLFPRCREGLREFSTVMQTLDFFSGLHNCLELSQPLSCLYQAMETRKTFSIA